MKFVLYIVDNDGNGQVSTYLSPSKDDRIAELHAAVDAILLEAEQLDNPVE